VSALSALLEVQKLDLACDRLREKRTALPARAALEGNVAALATLGREREAAEAAREVLAVAERELGGEVASIASKAKEVETNLYSGSVTVPKELDALHHELELWKGKQEEAEDRELELLERIEAADAGLGEQATRGGEVQAVGAELEAEIGAAEAAIDGEIAGLEEAANELRAGLPAPALTAYDRRRSNPRLAGRAAVLLDAGMCEGCRLTLPVMEHRRILDEPEEAVVSCPHCSRLLVR